MPGLGLFPIGHVHIKTDREIYKTNSQHTTNYLVTHAGPTKVGKKVGFDCSLVGIKTHCRGVQCLALTNIALKVTQMNHETKKI